MFLFCFVFFLLLCSWSATFLYILYTRRPFQVNWNTAKLILALDWKEKSNQNRQINDADLLLLRFVTVMNTTLYTSHFSRDLLKVGCKNHVRKMFRRTLVIKHHNRKASKVPSLGKVIRKQMFVLLESVATVLLGKTPAGRFQRASNPITWAYFLILKGSWSGNSKGYTTIYRIIGTLCTFFPQILQISQGLNKETTVVNF